MFYALKDFNAISKQYRKGDEVTPPLGAVQFWIDAGLISESKPEQAEKLETKPQPKKAKSKK